MEGASSILRSLGCRTGRTCLRTIAVRSPANPAGRRSSAACRGWPRRSWCCVRPSAGSASRALSGPRRGLRPRQTSPALPASDSCGVLGGLARGFQDRLAASGYATFRSPPAAARCPRSRAAARSARRDGPTGPATCDFEVADQIAGRCRNTGWRTDRVCWEMSSSRRFEAADGALPLSCPASWSPVAAQMQRSARR